jgi:ribosome-associated protein
VNLETLRKEIVFKAVRSGGAGGQHVNKVSTKVVLYFDLEKSKAFESELKELLIQKLQSKISQDGLIILSSDETRSQLKNKAAVWQKLILLIENQLKINKPRKETKIPRSVIEKRLKAKKINAQNKQNRRKNDY